MTLEEYLQEKGISQKEFALKFKSPVSQGLVSQWIRGVTRITLQQALEIDELTNHRVTPADCSRMYRDVA